MQIRMNCIEGYPLLSSKNSELLHGSIWSKVQSHAEILQDEQARANEYVVPVELPHLDEAVIVIAELMTESIVVMGQKLGWREEDLQHLDLHSSCVDGR